MSHCSVFAGFVPSHCFVLLRFCHVALYCYVVNCFVMSHCSDWFGYVALFRFVVCYAVPSCIVESHCTVSGRQVLSHNVSSHCFVMFGYVALYRHVEFCLVALNFFRKKKAIWRIFLELLRIGSEQGLLE